MRINDNSEKREYYTVPEVAQMFGVKRLTIYRWINEGRLPAVKLGQWRITKADIDTAIENQRKRGKDYRQE